MAAVVMEIVAPGSFAKTTNAFQSPAAPMLDLRFAKAMNPVVRASFAHPMAAAAWVAALEPAQVVKPVTSKPDGAADGSHLRRTLARQPMPVKTKMPARLSRLMCVVGCF